MCLEKEIKTLIIEALELEDITIEDIKDEEPLFISGLGLDSIDALELGMALKKKYHIDLSENKEENKPIGNIEVKGYKVEGIIKISKINIEYPILEKTTDEAMQYSVTHFWGDSVNAIGNYTIAGHNNIDGTMFGNTDRLEEGDIIELTGLDGKKVQYKIFKQYIIDPEDVSCVKSVKAGTREVTLITCQNGHKNRLVTKAREIEQE